MSNCANIATFSRLSDVDRELNNINTESSCAKERQELHIKLLESKILGLRAQLSLDLNIRTRLEEQKGQIQTLEKENQGLKASQDTPTKGIQSLMKSVTLKDKPIKEQLEAYRTKVQELESQIRYC